RAGEGDVEARVASRMAVDLGSGDLDAPDRGVAPACAQLELHHQPELPKRGQLGPEALEHLGDQLPGLGHRHAEADSSARGLTRLARLGERMYARSDAATAPRTARRAGAGTVSDHGRLFVPAGAPT